ncbi:pdz/dhr/glgf protein [Arcanobacterium bovis]|uniref:endopeptidase La n=1 Tax=Arcanobacterium bovis TaxID=2529275 RepID=A0A4Q9V033_9ACTO|nr:pdz/dhr/glgf protein [Arcanobacterium bovis]
MLLLLIASAVPSGYVVEGTGPALDVNSKVEGQPLVSVSDVQTYPSDTKLFMTTVSAYGNADAGAPVAQAVTALFRKDLQILPLRVMFPDNLSSEDVKKQNQMAMTSSQDTAALVAFEMAGYPVSMTLKVAGVSKDFPSGKKLQPGDVIKAIKLSSENDYHSISSFKQLASFLDATKPNTEVTMRLERNGKQVDESFTTVAHQKDANGWVAPGSILGVLIDVQDVKIPGKVKYIVEGIGGPSAGMMFTLGIYDQLTKESLGGKAAIAGTGTIAWNGNVGPIGGIEHKLQGAAEHGATDFIAPAENCRETIGYEPQGMNVWAVRTIDEARTVVESVKSGDTSKLTSCRDLLEHK